jgi:hypothetical protein
MSVCKDATGVMLGLFSHLPSPTGQLTLQGSTALHLAEDSLTLVADRDGHDAAFRRMKAAVANLARSRVGQVVDTRVLRAADEALRRDCGVP